MKKINLMKKIVLVSILLFCSQLIRSQVAVYQCHSTGAVGYCFNTSDVNTCAYNKCMLYGGKSPSQILFSNSKGYGSIAVSQSTNGVVHLGTSYGYRHQNEAQNRALLECERHGGNQCRLLETYYIR